MKHDGNDLLRRQDCIEAIEGITCSMSLCVNADECHGMKRMQRQAVLEIANMPAVQPDRDVIDDCLRHIYKNISVHTATGGVIAIRYYMEKLYEEIYGEGERPWWMK